MNEYREALYTNMFNALRHKVRREILLSLAEGEKSFTELYNLAGISSSHLDYHLDILDGLVKKSGSKYKLSESGKTTVKIIAKPESSPSQPKTRPSLNVLFKYTTVSLILLILLTFSSYTKLYEITLEGFYQCLIGAGLYTIMIMYPIALIGFVREYWLSSYIQN
jgi:DNA-binding transcriptional ArsR family regulator